MRHPGSSHAGPAAAEMQRQRPSSASSVRGLPGFEMGFREGRAAAAAAPGPRARFESAPRDETPQNRVVERHLQRVERAAEDDLHTRANEIRAMLGPSPTRESKPEVRVHFFFATGQPECGRGAAKDGASENGIGCLIFLV